MYETNPYHMHLALRAAQILQIELRNKNRVLMNKPLEEAILLCLEDDAARDFTRQAVAAVVEYPQVLFKRWDDGSNISYLMWNSLKDLERGLAACVL